MDLGIDDIERAAAALRGVTTQTRLQSSRTFSVLANADIWLKPECLQKTGSWKLRGAYTTLVRLSEGERARGVVTFSAGNWGQGVAYAAALLGVTATVVLPAGVTQAKLNAIVAYGANVVIHGGDSEDLFAKARDIEARSGMLLLNPLDNRDMMVGAATLALEITNERTDIDAIVVPVGGGALIAGIAAYVRLRHPNVRVYGVQPEGACAVHASLRAGTLVELDRVETVADGLAVKRPSADTVALISRTVDDVVLVRDEEIKAAMYLLLERAKLLVEPSGAASLAAVLNARIPAIMGQSVAVVLTGGNANLALLRDILATT
ncbi:MAG: threonine/serine dehydratase [bacterium]